MNIWPGSGKRRMIFSQRAQRNAENAETTIKRIVYYLPVSALSAFLCALCENTVHACLNKKNYLRKPSEV